jgi:predicted ABC-type ATPase
VELHLARIARRVSEGGHSIPEDLVRARFDSSRLNLIRLLPHLTELRLFDNSAESKITAPSTSRIRRYW